MCKTKKYTTIKEASKNAGFGGAISVDGVLVYWDGGGVQRHADGAATDLHPDNAIVRLGQGDEYRLAARQERKD